MKYLSRLGLPQVVALLWLACTLEASPSKTSRYTRGRHRGLMSSESPAPPPSKGKGVTSKTSNDMSIGDAATPSPTARGSFPAPKAPPIKAPTAAPTISTTEFGSTSGSEFQSVAPAPTPMPSINRDNAPFNIVLPSPDIITTTPPSASPVSTDSTATKTNVPSASPVGATMTSAPSAMATNAATSTNTRNGGIGGFSQVDGLTQPNDSAVLCPGAQPVTSQVVWWTYAVTMDNSSDLREEDADNAVSNLEPLLQSSLIGLLECDQPTRRRLDTDLGIVGMDSFPNDLRQEECDVSTTSNPCYVYIGSLFIYLDESADVNVATLETRKVIQSIMSQTQSLSIPNVSSVEYLSPSLSTPLSAETTQDRETMLKPNDDSSPTIPILGAVGGVFVVAAMIAGFRLHQDKVKVVDGQTTIGHSTIIGTASVDTDDKDMPSPCHINDVQNTSIVGTVPGTYRSPRSFAMDTILEDQSSVNHSRDSEILVSECGYTDDESSRDQSSFMNSILHDETSILGAQGMSHCTTYGDDDDDYLVLGQETQSPSKKSSNIPVSTSSIYS